MPEFAMPELLSAAEFCAKYPASGVEVEAWYRWLREWREQGYLVCGKHFLNQVKDTSVATIAYREKSVMRLIYKFREKPRQIFCQNIWLCNHEAITLLLSSSATPETEQSDKT